MECLTIVRDYLALIVTGFGIWVAWSGLSTWKKQLVGKPYHDLAHRLLLSITRFHDAIRDIRDPSFNYYLVPVTEEETKGLDREDIVFLKIRKAWYKRLEPAQTEIANLKALIIEAEALWGTELKELLEPMFFSYRKLRTAVEQNLILNNLKADPSEKNAATPYMKSTGKLLCESDREESKRFEAEVNSTVENIKKYLGKKFSLS